MTTPGALRDELWTAGEPVYRRILDHPFVTGLTSGELAPDRFRHYVAQDSHYLRQYARVLSILAGRAADRTATAMLTEHASKAVAVELALHGDFLKQLEPFDGVVDRPSPTTVAYTSYLMSVAHGGSFAEGVAAVLPCYWIYWEVGKALLEASSPNPIYARWIETYASDEFAAAVCAVLELTDRLGDGVSAAERDRMTEHYVTASKYEWMFWDAAYQKETWPL